MLALSCVYTRTLTYSILIIAYDLCVWQVNLYHKSNRGLGVYKDSQTYKYKNNTILNLQFNSMTVATLMGPD